MFWNRCHLFLNTHMNWIKSTLNTIKDPACREMPSGSFSRANGTRNHFKFSFFPGNDSTMLSPKPTERRTWLVQPSPPRDLSPAQPNGGWGGCSGRGPWLPSADSWLLRHNYNEEKAAGGAGGGKEITFENYEKYLDGISLRLTFSSRKRFLPKGEF